MATLQGLISQSVPFPKAVKSPASCWGHCSAQRLMRGSTFWEPMEPECLRGLCHYSNCCPGLTNLWVSSGEGFFQTFCHEAEKQSGKFSRKTSQEAQGKEQPRTAKARVMPGLEGKSRALSLSCSYLV